MTVYIASSLSFCVVLMPFNLRIPLPAIYCFTQCHCSWYGKASTLILQTPVFNVVTPGAMSDYVPRPDNLTSEERGPPPAFIVAEDGWALEQVASVREEEKSQVISSQNYADRKHKQYKITRMEMLVAMGTENS